MNIFGLNDEGVTSGGPHNAELFFRKRNPLKKGTPKKD